MTWVVGIVVWLLAGLFIARLFSVAKDDREEF